MIRDVEQLLKIAQNSETVRLAIAAAGDETVLKSVKKAASMGIVEPIFIGNKEKIKSCLNNIDYNFTGNIINVDSNRAAANKAIELISENKADLPMKGLLSSRLILKALLNKKYNLYKENSLLSLVTLIYLENEERLVFITDGGMNIAPDLQEKAKIVNNAVKVAKSMGIKEPLVAPLAAVEKVNPEMSCTLDAAALAKMADRGQIMGTVDGPLAFDNAISKEAARHKGINSPVAGKANILLVPDIEAGNILYKSLVIYGQHKSASLVYGAKIPLVLTSRADRAETKLYSIALAKIVNSGLQNLK